MYHEDHLYLLHSQSLPPRLNYQAKSDYLVLEFGIAILGPETDAYASIAIR
jgi:hypothetical protein